MLLPFWKFALQLASRDSFCSWGLSEIEVKTANSNISKNFNSLTPFPAKTSVLTSTMVCKNSQRKCKLEFYCNKTMSNVDEKVSCWVYINTSGTEVLSWKQNN